MHHLIASYLFQNKTCPLPGLGTLSIVQLNAETDFSNTAIKTPAPNIVFDSKETDADNLLDYIASKTHFTALELIEMLAQFGNNIKTAVIANTPAALNGVGNFFTDVSGNINFKPGNLPAAFLQPVKAERVIHPQAEHNILVGDKETTNTVMTEYFSDETPVKKSRWWIWAIVIGIIALVMILIYLINNVALSSMLGNATPI